MKEKIKKELKNSKGFTLIELLVVIAIIGLLATMSVVALNSAREKARDSRRLSDVKQVQTALEMYYSTAGVYPSNSNFTVGSSIATSSQTFMGSIPSNPTPVNDGDCPSGAEYQYDSNGLTYTIMYCLGAQTNDIVSGTNCAMPSGINATSTVSDVCVGPSGAMSW